MQESHLPTYFFLIVLSAVVVVSVLIFLPYLNALVLAGVFAILFRPLFRRFLSMIPSLPGLASLLTIMVVILLIVIPLFFFGRQVFQEAQNVFFAIRDGADSGILDFFTSKLNGFIDAKEHFQSILSWVVGHVGSVFASVTQVVITFFVALVALFYFLKDGTRIKNALIELSPLPNQYDHEIFDRLHLAVNSVIRGSLVIAVIQGVLAGIGFSIFHIPNPALWGGLAMFAALIPGIGTSLVLIPAVIFAFLSGTLGNAIGLLVWGMLAVGLIDNFLGPKLVGKRIKIHELLILLSVLGGIGMFGPMGFIIGPLVLSLLFTLLDIYKNVILNNQLE